MFCTYDLHSHSTASDGTLSPTALVAMAARAGVKVFALTDHDSTEGVPEARRAAESEGIRLISGAEISVTWNKQTVHIVGLNLDIHSNPLQQGLQGLHVHHRSDSRSTRRCPQEHLRPRGGRHRYSTGGQDRHLD